jgi:predicted PurR-regulated permease PerM
MGILGGFLGILIAAPLTITAIVLTKHLYVEDTLEDTHLQAVDP